MQSHFPLFVAAAWRWLSACVLCWALWPVTSHAHDHILATAYWTDPTGTASFEQAREARYTPYTGVLSQGFGRQAQWIRLTIGASAHPGTDALVLRIRPVFLDEITLYDPVDLAQGRAPRRAGDTTLFSASEFESLNHSFLIPAQPAPREVWLRLVTTSTQLMHVEALAPREMLREEQSLGLVYSGLLAVILSCLVWVLLAWLRDRDQVNGLFVLRQTVLFLYTACFLGYHRIVLSGHLTPDTQDALYSWLVLFTSGLSCLFEYRFLSEYAMPRWAHWLMRALLACSVVAMTLMVLGQEHASLQLNTLYVSVILISLLLVALCVRPRAPSGEQPPAYVLPRAALVSYYALILVVLGLSILPGLGVEMLRGSTLSIYGVMLYGLSWQRPTGGIPGGHRQPAHGGGGAQSGIQTIGAKEHEHGLGRCHHGPGPSDPGPAGQARQCGAGFALNVDARERMVYAIKLDGVDKSCVGHAGPGGGGWGLGC